MIRILPLAVALSAFTGCEVIGQYTFESDEARAMQKIADQSQALEIVVRQLTFNRKVGNLTKEQFLITEPYVKELYASIKAAQAHVKAGDYNAVDIELNLLKHGAAQLKILLIQFLQKKGLNHGRFNSPTGWVNRRGGIINTTGHRQDASSEGDYPRRSSNSNGNSRLGSRQDDVRLRRAA